MKRALDGIFAFCLLPFLLILAAIVFVLIKLDDGGPVFFRQPRLGLHAQTFSIWKFRTMVVDADRYVRSDGSVEVDRITRTGRVLRKLSIDEFPQILNILNGSMSFVGPRPVLVSHLPRYNLQQRKRFLMRPGITGLAQVHGRNELPWSQCLIHDVEYVEQYSLSLDVKIIVKTLWMVMTGRGIVLDRNPQQVDDLPSKKS